jgi:hypothetical protein
VLARAVCDVVVSLLAGVLPNVVAPLHPEGIKSPEPKVARPALPWESFVEDHNPERGCILVRLILITSGDSRTYPNSNPFRVSIFKERH